MEFRRVLAVVGFSLFAISERGLAGVNAWSAIGPTGGVINKIAFSTTPNTVFLIAAGGFYRSQDGGMTWQLVSENFLNAPTDLRLDPSDPTRIYVTAQNAPALYVSSDGGNTLSASTTLPSAVTQVAQLVVSQNGTTIYIASGAKIFSSSDRGQTWHQRTAVGTDPLARVTTLVIDPTDSNTLYASVITGATGDAVLASHDGAVTWQPLTTDPAQTSFAYGLAVNAANPMQLWAARGDGVWVSNDRGVTWNAAYNTPAFAVVIDPDTAGVVYVGTATGQILRTANSGVNWSDVTGDMGAGQVISMAVNPAHNSQLMVGGYGGLAVSSTSGTTWSMQQTGIYSTNIAGLSADPTVDRIYIEVPTGGAFFEAAGAGATQPVNNAGLLGLVGGPGTSFNITAQLATAGHLYVSLEGGLATSTDGGNTWSLEPIIPGGNNQIFALASPAGAPQSVLAATFSTLYRTTDAGATWNEVGGGLPAGASVGRLLTAPSDPMAAYAYLSNVTPFAQLGIYASADGGVNWSAASGASASPVLPLAVDPTAAKTLYGATASALLKSTDGGATWTTLPWNSSAAQGYPSALAVDPVHPQLLFASSVASIMRSPDGGMTWETLRAANVLPTWGSLQLLVDPLRPENLLVGTGGSGVQQLTVSPDLALSVVAPTNPVAVGVKSTFTYTITNVGPFAATDVKVSLQLPASAQSVSATIAGGTCTTAVGSVTCVLPVLSTGVAAALTLNATAPAAGAFAITGTVSGDQPDFNPKNNLASTTSTVSVLSDLAVTTSAGTATAQVGGAVSFTVTVNNAGPNAAPATVLTVQLPAGLSNGAATTSAGTCTTNASGLISCSLNTLAVASAATVTVNATAATAGSQASTATASTAAVDTASANNSSTLTISVNAVPPPSGGSGGGELSVAELLALVSLLALRASRRRTV